MGNDSTLVQIFNVDFFSIEVRIMVAAYYAGVIYIDNIMLKMSPFLSGMGIASDIYFLPDLKPI